MNIREADSCVSWQSWTGSDFWTTENLRLLHSTFLRTTGAATVVAAGSSSSEASSCCNSVFISSTLSFSAHSGAFPGLYLLTWALLWAFERAVRSTAVCRTFKAWDMLSLLPQYLSLAGWPASQCPVKSSHFKVCMHVYIRALSSLVQCGQESGTREAVTRNTSTSFLVSRCGPGN